MAFPDSESYWSLGKSIAEGRPYTYGPEEWRIFRMPGYPLILAGYFRVFGTQASLLGARLLGCLLGGVSVLLTAWLARRLFDEKGALLAALMVALYPGAIMMSVLVLSEALFVPLMLFQLILLVKLAESSIGSDCFPRCQLLVSLSVGLVGGLATLVRPSWILLTPLAAVALVALSKGERRRAGIAATLMILGMAVVMTPWWVRNWKISGQFVITTSQTGASLYDGLHKCATGASDMSFLPEFIEEQRAADASAVSRDDGLFELRLDRRLRRAAIDWAQAHPGQVVKLAAIKTARTWNIWPNEPSLQNGWIRVVVFFGYLPPLVLGAAGAWRLGRERWSVLICLVPAVYLTLLHAAFVGSIRYRQPAMMAVIVLAAGWLSLRLQDAKRESRVQSRESRAKTN